MKIVRTDRSRVECAQHCLRERFLRYHQDDLGIDSIRRPLPLCVGSSVHVGIAELLREGQKLWNSTTEHDGLAFTRELRSLEDYAVKTALADFSQYAGALDVDTTEQTALVPVPGESLASLLAQSLGMSATDPSVEALAAAQGDAKSKLDEYLYLEQSSLVEALIRSYARRKLRPLLDQYEVLEVEREGEWLLGTGQTSRMDPPFTYNTPGTNYTGAITFEPYDLWFMSRPDALLLERDSRQLYLYSLKTTGAWDIRRQRDAEHDMQGLSEGVEVERRLATWWQDTQDTKRKDGSFALQDMCKPGSNAMVDFLASCTASPRILAIRYDFILKGERWRDKDLSARLGLDTRSQRSHLIRGYLNPGMASGDEQWNWSWDYLKDGGELSKLNYRQWKSTPVWEHTTVAKWIDMLDTAHMEQSGEVTSTGENIGIRCDAQATGLTAEHPLDSVFLPPVIIYRNDDDLRDMVEQLEAQERRIAESVAQVEAATDEGERRHLLNVLFPQTRRACEYPSTCAFVRICYGGEDIRRDPLASGQYRKRVPHHLAELEATTKEKP